MFSFSNCILEKMTFFLFRQCFVNFFPVKMVNQCLKCKNLGSRGFYSLPAEENHRRLWIQALGLPEKYVMESKKSWRICFRHWAASDFNTGGRFLKVKKGKVFTTYKYTSLDRRKDTRPVKFLSCLKDAFLSLYK